MKMRKLVGIFLLMMALVMCVAIAVPLSAWAMPRSQRLQQVTPPPPTSQPGPASIKGDKTVFGGNFVLLTEQALQGDLFVMGGNADLQAGSLVDGDVSVLGGNVRIAGEVKGDVYVLGGNVLLESTAIVRGQTGAIGGNISQNSGAIVEGGSAVVRPAPVVPAVPAVPSAPTPPSVPRTRVDLDFFDNWFDNRFDTMFNIVANTLLALAAWYFFPSNMARARDVALRDVKSAGVFGALSVAAFAAAMVVAAIAITIFAITVIGIPVSLLLVLAVVLAGFLFAAAAIAGWAVAAQMIGAWMQRGFGRQDWTTLMQVLIGGATLAVVTNVPPLGWIVGVLASFVGIGAITMTRFGSRDYIPPVISAPTSMSLTPGNNDRDGGADLPRLP